MPLGLWNIEWLNANSQRAYPLTDESTGIDDSASFTIPEDFLLELDLPLHAGLDIDPAKLYIKNIGAYATGYSIIVGYDGSDGPVDVATALIPKQTHTRNRTYALGGIAPFEDTVGKVVIGVLDSIDQQPGGFFTFSLANTRLEPDCARPIIRGVSSIVLVNGTQRSDPLYGDIELIAGSNIQLVPATVDDDTAQVVINAITGEGLIESCVCEGDIATAPIKTINGISPTPEGDFTLLAGTCLDFDALTNGLKLTNTCAQPCCGCPELERITEDLERLMREASTVEDFVQRLQASVQAMETTVLASKLNDTGCTQC